MHKWLSISAVIVALDLYTKHLVQQAFTYGEHLRVTGFLIWCAITTQVLPSAFWLMLAVGRNGFLPPWPPSLRL